jgi:hypothetical protein
VEVRLWALPPVERGELRGVHFAKVVPVLRRSLYSPTSPSMRRGCYRKEQTRDTSVRRLFADLLSRRADFD